MKKLECVRGKKTDEKFEILSVSQNSGICEKMYGVSTV